MKEQKKVGGVYCNCPVCNGDKKQCKKSKREIVEGILNDCVEQEEHEALRLTLVEYDRLKADVNTIEQATREECQGAINIDMQGTIDALKAEVERLKCPRCGGTGSYPEHDPRDPHIDGCSSCPIEVQCDCNQAICNELTKAQTEIVRMVVRIQGIDIYEIVKDMDNSVDTYEMRGDDGDYSPNARERFLMTDFLAGFLDELAEATKKKIKGE